MKNCDIHLYNVFVYRFNEKEWKTSIFRIRQCWQNNFTSHAEGWSYGTTCSNTSSKYVAFCHSCSLQLIRLSSYAVLQTYQTFIFLNQVWQWHSRSTTSESKFWVWFGRQSSSTRSFNHAVQLWHSNDSDRHHACTVLNYIHKYQKYMYTCIFFCFIYSWLYKVTYFVWIEVVLLWSFNSNWV